MTLLDWLRSWFRPKPAPTPSPQPPPAPPNNAIAAINAERASHGLKPLAEDPRLTKAASDWAGTMHTLGRMSHSDIGSLMAKLNCPVAECVAEMQGPTDAGLAVAAWMADQPHARIILGNYTHCGVGHVGAYWTADFAREG